MQRSHPSSPTSLPRRLGALLGWFIAVASGSAAYSESIAVAIETQCSTTAAHVHCDALVRSTGDAAARDLAVTLAVDGEAIRSDSTDLEPGAEHNFGLALDRIDAEPGVHAASVMTTYRDGEGYPLSTVSALLLEIGTPQESRHGNLEIVLQPTTLDRLTGEALVTLHNPGVEVRTAEVRLLLPRELEAEPARAEVEVGARATESVRFRLRNRGALPPSRYAVFAVARSRDPAGVSSALAESSLRVVVPEGPTIRHRALVVTAVALVFGLGLRPRRWSASQRPAAAIGWESWIDALLLGATLLFLLDHLRVDLLNLPTITAGGDTASHYSTVEYLRRELLPSGRLLGWMPGNLGGFPIFQLYFPLPFLLMLPLTWVVPLPIAFKWITLAGTLLLPGAAFTTLRAFRFERPIPALGALSTLPFLFQEGNSVWGGNLLSTLAGEFTYSFALALVVLFAGVSYRALTGRSGWCGAAILLAAIGLSHAYALLFAATWITLSVVWLPDAKRSVVRVAQIGAGAFLLLGFWILPLLGYAGYTTPYADLWSIEGWRQLAPPLLWPSVAIAAIAGVVALRRILAGRRIDARIGVLVTGLVAALVLHSVAHRLGVVDIRFLPFAQVFVGLVAATALGSGLRAALDRRGAVLAPLVLLALAAAAIDRSIEIVPAWVQWNYSGFENKPAWEPFRQVNESLRGDAGDPRVVFEHAPEHNAAGSIRAFESLPLFSGRSTLEGLYIQSSLLSPEIFYLQSELSATASCPLPNFHCTRLDPARAAEHLRLFNVSQVVARSPEVKSELAASPEFDLEHSIDDYAIFRVNESPGRYVEALPREPIWIDPEVWSVAAFRWFGQASRRTPVLARRPGAERLSADPTAVDRLLATTPASALVEAPRVAVEESIGSHRIEIRTSHPGHPLLVRVAYHPRWRAESGEPIALATPGFMLVTPQSEHLVLRFGETATSLVGKLLSAIGAAVLALVGFRQRRQRPAEESELHEVDRGAPRYAPAALVGLAIVLFALRPALRADFAPSRFDAGMEHYRAEEWAAARREYARAIEASPLGGAALAARFFDGLAAFRQEDHVAVVERFTDLTTTFPDSKHAAEAGYHLGLSHERLGQEIAARRAYGRVATSDLAPWSERAQEALARLESPLGDRASDLSQADRPPAAGSRRER